MLRKRLIDWVFKIPRIEDVMSKPVINIEVDVSVMDVIRLMNNKRIGSVVITMKGEPVGIFTRRDLMERVLIRQASLLETKIDDVMSSPVITMKPSDNVIKAVGIMKKNRVTRILVLDDSKPIGLLTETDIGLKLSKCSLSYRSAFKRYIIDTLGYIVFWSWIIVLIQIVIVGIPIEKFITTSTIGFIVTMLLGGLFGRFIDVFRSLFGVD